MSHLTTVRIGNDTRAGRVEGDDIVLLAATDVGDISASVPPSARRFVVPLGPSAEEGLGQAYARLAADPELRGALAEEGRAHVVERYSIDAMVARYLEIYGAALER